MTQPSNTIFVTNKELKRKKPSEHSIAVAQFLDTHEICVSTSLDKVEVNIYNKQ